MPGITIIRNAAKEPEIVGLCDYLTGCGADIKGAGGDTIAVRGVDKLNDTVYTIPADRMVMGTYIASACVMQRDFSMYTRAWGLSTKSAKMEYLYSKKKDPKRLII